MNQAALQANIISYADSGSFGKYVTGIGPLGGYGTTIEKTVQKTGKLLADLRAEIDDWHGDILKA